ncbi:MAG: alkaline phosphatase family protein, partial [Acidobacteriia bacterium]|nr:alkaline phosphatase family protein [Terriglobia bacterium]
MHMFVLLGLLMAATALPQPVIPAKQRIVVLVSIDGFPAFALDDLLLPVPNIRKLAAQGALARSLEPVNPTVTWPNHTSMVTGVTPSIHKVLFNGLLVRAPGEAPRVDPWVDKSKLVHSPTVYDAAHKAGLTTAEVDWVAIQNPGTITWSFAERPSMTGVIEKELIAAGVVRPQEIEQFAKAGITWRDHIWTQAAAHIIRRHKPNLLLFHLLTTDSTHH